MASKCSASEHADITAAAQAITPDATLSQTSNASVPMNNPMSNTSGSGAFYEVAIQVDKPYFVKDGQQYPDSLWPGSDG